MTADLYADINNRRVYLYLTTLTFYIIILPKEIKFTETKKNLLKNGFWKEKNRCKVSASERGIYTS